MKLKVGDRVKVIDNSTMYYGAVGDVVGFYEGKVSVAFKEPYRRYTYWPRQLRNVTRSVA